MQVVFESRDTEAHEMRDVAESRLRFALRRLAWLVPRATLRMTDVNGPRGGVDKRCQVELKTPDGNLVVTSISRHWRDSLDTALARAARALSRSHQRRYAQRRQPGAQPAS